MKKNNQNKKITNYYLPAITIILILFTAFTLIKDADVAVGATTTTTIKCTCKACSASNWCSDRQYTGTGCPCRDTCSDHCECGATLERCKTTTTTTTTKPSTTTTTTGGGGSCECINSNGSWTCWDKINNKCCSSCGTCPPQWSCSKSPLGCYESSSGYAWKDSCEDNCYNGYSCYPGFVCRVSWLGTYETLSSCEACCRQDPCNSTTYYSCNPDPDNPHCIVDSNGSYTSWAYCDDNCGSDGNGGGTTTTTANGGTTTTTNGGTTTTTNGATTTTTSPPPTCQINSFTINEKDNSEQNPLIVWVNASLRGHFSVNYCTSCEVISNDIWSNTYDPLPSSGDVTEQFKINTADNYSYTLECIGDPDDPNDSDEDFLSLKAVQAVNLPWWREIIPYLGGFLRGL